MLKNWSITNCIRHLFLARDRHFLEAKNVFCYSQLHCSQAFWYQQHQTRRRRLPWPCSSSWTRNNTLKNLISQANENLIFCSIFTDSSFHHQQQVQVDCSLYSFLWKWFGNSIPCNQASTSQALNRYWRTTLYEIQNSNLYLFPDFQITTTM